MTTSRLRHAAGQRLGRWTLIAPVGIGGFSEVWRASAGDEVAAVKVITRPEHVEQVRAEASSLALVRGQGVVPVHEAALEHDPPFLVLELLTGGDLRRRAFDAEADGTELVLGLRMIRKIAEVLARVHAEGVVHGDLKPENVLFDGAGRLHLTDFGLSRRLSQCAASLSVSLSVADAKLAGTVDYLAPEQRAGAKASARSDVYACGVILYEVIVGHRPQGAFSLPGELDPAIPPAIDRLVASCLAADPASRPADGAELLQAVREAAESAWREVEGDLRGVRELLEGGVTEREPMWDTLAVGVSIWLTLIYAFVDAMNDEPTDVRGPPGPLSTGTWWARLAVGLVVAVVLAVASSRRIRPWFTRRRRALRELELRLSLQWRAIGAAFRR